MPYAVTHILVPIVLLSLFRDFYLKKRTKKKFPLHYVLIAGLGGVLPDIDFIFSAFLNLIGVGGWNIHRTFTHSLFFPLLFLVLFLVFYGVNAKARVCNLTRHKLKLNYIFLFVGIGCFIHILLDALVGVNVFFFYPFSNIDFGLNLIRYLPKDLQGLSMPLLDGSLLVIWIIYLELKHKISDFI